MPTAQGHITVRRRAKDGDDGAPAIVFELMPSASSIKQSGSTFIPSYLTCAIKKTQGSAYYIIDTAEELNAEGLTLQCNFDSGSYISIDPTSHVAPTVGVNTINFRLIKDSIVIANVSVHVLTNGADAYTVILTNEAQSIATDTDLKPLSSTYYDTQVKVYRGATELTAVTSVTSEDQFGVVTPSSVPGLTITQPTPGTIRFTTSTGTAIAETGTIEITIVTLEKQFKKIFSYSASKQGNTGADAKSLDLLASTYVVALDSEGNLKNSADIVLTAVQQNDNTTVVWSTSPSVSLSGSGLTRTLNPSVFLTYDSIEITVTAGALTDKITIVRVRDAAIIKENLIQNSGFEFGFESWLKTETPMPEIDTTNYVSGVRSIKFTGQVGVTQYLQQNVFLPNSTKKYTFSGYIKTTDVVLEPTSSYVRIRATIIDGAEGYHYVYGTTISGTTGWTRYFITIDPSGWATPNIAEIRAFLMVDNMTGTVWADNFMLTEGSLSEWMPSLSDQSIPGQIIRQVKWVPGETYHNDDRSVAAPRYLDILLIFSSAGVLTARYMCKGTYTSEAEETAPSGSGNTHWSLMNNMAPLYTPVLMADTGEIIFLQSNRIVIQKADGTITAGLSGAGEGATGYRIWAGGANPATAKFRVTELGEMYGEDVEITGEVNASSGTLGILTMQSGGKINLPPSWDSSIAGYINPDGIRFYYSGSNNQRIEWYSGLGVFAGKIYPDSNGYLNVKSDYGINIDASSNPINIGDVGLDGDITIGNTLRKVLFNGAAIEDMTKIRLGYSSGYGIDLTSSSSVINVPGAIVHITPNADNLPITRITIGGSNPSNGDLLILVNTTSNYNIKINSTATANNGYFRALRGQTTMNFREGSAIPIIYSGGYWSILGMVDF